MKDSLLTKSGTLAMIVAAAILTVSCDKVSPSQGDAKPGEGTIVISAAIENELTKTALDGDDDQGYKVVWSEGDKFTINGHEYELIKGAGTTGGEFSGPDFSADGLYHAWYCMTDEPLSFSAVQPFAAGQINYAPMLANFTVVNGVVEPIKFKNIGGLVRVSLKDAFSQTLKSITISAAENMAGYINIAQTDVIFNGTSKSVTLDCGDQGALITSDSSDFFLALFPGTYSGVKIMVTMADGLEVTKSLKAGKVLSVDRSMITRVGFSLSEGCELEVSYSVEHFNWD